MKFVRQIQRYQHQIIDIKEDLKTYKQEGKKTERNNGNTFPQLKKDERPKI